VWFECVVEPFVSSRQYLIRRGNTWSATVEIPKPIRALVNGKSRFVKALGTSNLAEANRLKLPLVAEWKRQIALLEKQGKSDPLAGIIKAAMAFREAFAAHDNEWLEHGDQESGAADELLEAARNDAETVLARHGSEAKRVFLAVATGKATLIRDHYPTWIAEFVGTEQTKDQGAFAVNRYLSWAGEAASAEEVTKKKAGQFVGHLLETSGRSRRTLERYISSLSSFWRWMLRRGHIETEVNPWLGHGLASKKGKKPTHRALPDEAVLKLLTARYIISGQRAERRYETVLPDVVRIALATGMRLGEICELEAGDVEKREDGYWFNLGEGKTEAAERSVPVHPCIVPIVERRLKDKDRYLIANLVRGGRDKRRGHHVSKAFGRFRKHAGVKERWQDMHALRHTFTSCIEGHDVLESTTKLLIGHSRGSLTYGHYSRGDRVNLRAAMDKLDYGRAIMEAIANAAPSSVN
jgi:integrase